jgi:hypothetical protein
VTRGRAVGGTALGAALLVAWLGFRAVQIRGHLESAQATLAGAADSISAADVDQLAAKARRAAPELHAARSEANDPIWRLAAAVPIAGRSFALVRGVTQVTARVVDDVVGPAEHAATTVREGQLLKNGRVDLALLDELRGPLAAADRSAALARRQADSLPHRLIPGALLRRRNELVAQVDRLAGGVDAASTALEIAPSMLGADGPRRYLLVVQNPAETRATGGLIGAYAVIRADRGKLTRERVGTDSDLRPATRPVVDLGKEFARHYDPYQGRLSWFSATRSPDWPSAAAVLAGLWRAQSGTAPDGVIGVDPLALSAVLTATGPIDAGGQTLDAGNIADFVERDQYAKFADPSQPFGQRSDQRKAVLGGLAAAIYDKVASGQGSGTALVKGLATAGRSGHLQVWSAHAQEESQLARAKVGGALPSTREAFLEVVSQNASGSKLDYYVKRTIRYVRAPKHAALARVTLLNTVDAKAVPPFVKARVDVYGFNPNLSKLALDGTTTQLLSVYATRAIERVRIDGREVPAAFGTERGHGYATVKVVLKPGVPVVVQFDLADPGGALHYRQQPLAHDDVLDIQVPYGVD